MRVGGIRVMVFKSTDLKQAPNKPQKYNVE